MNNLLLIIFKKQKQEAFVCEKSMQMYD